MYGFSVYSLADIAKQYKWKNKDTLIRFPGEKWAFRCSCGCNVFRKHSWLDKYKCNSCKAIYIGEK